MSRDAEGPGTGTGDPGPQGPEEFQVDEQRRDLLKFLVAAPLAPFAITVLGVERAADSARDALLQLTESGEPFRPRFFTSHEWRTVRVLSDLVIPRDERSGSATDAGVPEFMDFIMTAYPNSQAWMRDGLAWLDGESNKRFTVDFVTSKQAQRMAVLDDIAWPKRARAEMKDGAQFFSRFRDLTSSGFWSSRMGVQDLRYIGNTAVPQWNGCPPAALRKLSVGYAKKGARGEG